MTAAAAAVGTCTAESSQKAAAEARMRENKFSAIFPSSRPSGAVTGWSGYGGPGATYRYPESSHVLPADCLVSGTRTVSATALVSSPDDLPRKTSNPARKAVYDDLHPSPTLPHSLKASHCGRLALNTHATRLLAVTYRVSLCDSFESRTVCDTNAILVGTEDTDHASPGEIRRRGLDLTSQVAPQLLLFYALAKIFVT